MNRKIAIRRVSLTSTAMALALGIAGFLPLEARAQSAETQQNAGQGLQEIVVTAERRAARLQDTPISVAAITPEQIDSEGLRNIDDLTRLSPGVTFERNSFTAVGNYNDEGSDIAIRGVDSTAGASTTGIYIDDTPIQTRHLSFGTVNPFPVLFDLDRVEVLRGPQGTLFGAGSEGGTVRFLLPEPGLETYTGYFRAELSTTENGDPSYEMAAAVGGPIVRDVLGFRLSASVRDDGGYVDKVNYVRSNDNSPVTLQPLNTIAENNNWERTATLRGALKWQVNDDLTISPSIYYQQLYLNDTSAFWPSLSNRGAGELRSGNLQPDTSYDPLILGSIKIDWNLGPVQLTNNTSYFYRNQAATSDYSQFMNTVFAYYPGAYGTPYPAVGAQGSAHFTDEQRNLTEELRLQSNDSSSPFSWTGGIFIAFLHENTTEWVQDSSLPLPGEVNGFEYFQNPFEAIDHQYAAFGQTDYSITPEIKLTAGVRVAIMETKGYQYYAGPFVGPNAGTASATFTEYPVTPKFGASYQPDRDDLYYASVAKGYRVGGINASLGPLCSVDLGALGITQDPPTYA
jgi:outer membrane receptor protein involved in Fe transport